MGLKLNTRFIQISLGLLWVLNGLLQLQPRMFTPVFADQVLAPAAQNQPGFVSYLVHFALHIVLAHPAIINALIATLQLALGGLILFKRTLRIGLIGSILWSILVWSMGEGFGGIFSGHALLLMGAPGAAIIYAVLGLAVIPKSNRGSSPAYWLILVWACLWIGGAIFQLMPPQNSSVAVGQMIASNASSSPGWLGAAQQNLGATITHFDYPYHQATLQAAMPMKSVNMVSVHPGYLFVWMLAMVELSVGLLALAGRAWRKSAVIVGIALSLVFWIFGQNFGGIFSGLATDLNSGPLFVLLGLAILGIKPSENRLHKLGQKIEQTLIGKPETAETRLIEPATSEF